MLVCRMLAPLVASMFVAVVTVVVVEKNAVHLPFQKKIWILNAERLKTPRAKKNHRRKRIETGQASVGVLVCFQWHCVMRRAVGKPVGYATHTTNDYVTHGLSD